MNLSQQQQEQDFLDRFFGPPNEVWPGCAPSHSSATYLAPMLAALPARDERPLVLPRVGGQIAGQPRVAAATYVICWGPAHAERIRHLLGASVAHNWAPFPGRTAELDRDDPIDAAVIDLVGPNTTYILRPPDQQRHAGMWRALRRMIQALSEMPRRSIALPRPVGRILNDFELALASGQAEESLRLLDELEHAGGLSLENQTFLAIRRLSRLGQDDAVLAHPSLATIVMAEPPTAVRDAVLSAWMRAFTEPGDFQHRDGVQAAARALTAFSPDVALLAGSDLIGHSPDTDTALALVALSRADPQLAAQLAALSSLPAAVPDLLGALANPVDQPVDTPATTEAQATGGDAYAGIPDVAGPEPAPTGWLEWAASVMEASTPTPPDPSQWQPAADVDDRLSALIDDLDDAAASMMVAPFIDNDQFGTPAWRTARALLERMLLAERFTPAELASKHVLLEIFLRGSPPEHDYQQLLAAVTGYLGRWVSVSNALPALDIADTIACAARPDESAAKAFVSALLAPLHAQTSRLTPDLRALGNLITTEMNLRWNWQPPTTTTQQPPPQEPARPLRVLLYSLDAAVLDRVERAATGIAPGLIITKASDKDGSPQLRDKARNSDIVVLATRCATHAATGFITDNCGKAQIIYPDGAGSASMIRALADAVIT